MNKPFDKLRAVPFASHIRGKTENENGTIILQNGKCNFAKDISLECPY